MVKSELMQQLCNIHPNILRKDIEKILDIIIFEIIEALYRNEAVEIRGFGRFKTVIRKARIGRNPKNSTAIQIPAKKAIKWKMSKILFKRLNKNFTENKISTNY
uniref:Putative bacterial DNA-binding protein n=2 Tax=root TaxID=1 RepID=B3TCT5_9BACT|nr:putative bacterial DNA-binding protein [uncultured marine microorganism HF4000_005D21]ABZ10394.1 putative bacterial DNA-binding protein [uncultured marine bacterium HF4000_APKG3108]